MDRSFLVSSSSFFAPPPAAAAKSRRRSGGGYDAPHLWSSNKDQNGAVATVATTPSVATKIDDAATSSLQFVASTSFRTEPVPLPTPSSRLVEFFQSAENRNRLLVGHGSSEAAAVVVVDETSSSSSLGNTSPSTVEPFLSSASSPVADNLVWWERWAQEASATGTPPPRPDVDELLLVKSSGIPFPLGLTMYVESIVGASLVLPTSSESSSSSSSLLLEYQFTLIKDTVRAEGPRVIVWTFDKIMQAKKGDQQTTHSYSTVSVVVKEASDRAEITFQSDAQLEVNLSFPQTLLRILPMSREQSNTMGSKSIQATFDVKGAASLQNFEKAYREWIDSIATTD
jgi:hypothetical protein